MLSCSRWTAFLHCLQHAFWRTPNVFAYFFFKQWLFLATLLPALWNIQLNVVLRTDTPISTVELCSSFRVVFGLFVASLINSLLVWSVSFGGRPFSWKGLLWCHILTIFLIMDLMVPCGLFNFYLFFYPTLICTSPQCCPWPVWRAPWSSWCHMLSGVAESGAVRKRCIYTEIMWHLDCTQVDFV